MYKVKTLLGVLLCLLAFLSFSSCTKQATADSTKTKKSDDVITVSAKSDTNEIYISKNNKSDMTEICQMDMLTLYFDKENYSVAVYDKTSSFLWRALPSAYKNKKAAVISVNVLVDGVEYTLNSQSDSVAFSSCLYDISENAVSVSYGFKRTLEDGTKISITVPAVYRLKDGVFSVEIDCENLVGDETHSNVVLKSICVLPFFGSYSDGTDGDFILLPSGSGVIVDTSEKADKFKTLSTEVYSAENGNETASIAAFGMKRNNSAFVCLIEDGEEFATISVDKALKSKGYNSIGAKFTITPTDQDEEFLYASNEKYTGKIKLSYRFLSFESADYVSMASAVRELLIRNGSLTESNISSYTEYPFNLKLNFTEEGETVTNFSQCYDLLSSLKAKGFSSINLIISGALKKNAFTLDKKYGSESDFQKIKQYADIQGIKLFSEINAYETEDDFAVNLKDETEAVIKGSAVMDKFDEMIADVMKSEFDAVVVNDAGKYIYSDYTKGGVNLKDSLKETVGVICRSISTFKDLAVSGANLYSLKYARYAVDVSCKSDFDENKYCVSVPFVQSVLHGTIEYSHESINLAEDMVFSMLKCAEYGAVPYFEWHYSDLSYEDEIDMAYYMETITLAQTFYEKMKATFFDLADSRITAHEEIKANVYRTEFDNSTEIYVNYSKKAVTVNGVIIDAQSFLRVN